MGFPECSPAGRLWPGQSYHVLCPLAPNRVRLRGNLSRRQAVPSKGRSTRSEHVDSGSGSHSSTHSHDSGQEVAEKLEELSQAELPPEGPASVSDELPPPDECKQKPAQFLGMWQGLAARPLRPALCRPLARGEAMLTVSPQRGLWSQRTSCAAPCPRASTHASAPGPRPPASQDRMERGRGGWETGFLGGDSGGCLCFSLFSLCVVGNSTTCCVTCAICCCCCCSLMTKRIDGALAGLAQPVD